MKAVIQRVNEAKLSVDGHLVSSIGCGLVIYLGIESSDDESFIEPFCKKVSALRIFSDINGKMNYSVKDVGGQILLVSQFTLCADISHGNRPDFMSAMKPARAKELYEECAARLNEFVTTVTGVFGADMTIEQVNAGPVTIIY